MKKTELCIKCRRKTHLVEICLPEIGDKIVITNNRTAHDIPIGTIMEVEHLHGGFGGACVMDYKVSPKINDIPELEYHGIAILNCDYTVIDAAVGE